MTKVYRASERSWTEGADLEAINAAARKSIGRDRTEENMEDWARNLFQNKGSSHHPEKRNAPFNAWNENEAKQYKRIRSDSFPIHQNRTGDAQYSVSAGSSTSVVHNIVSATAFNAQTTPINPVRNDVLETAIQIQDIKFPFSLQEHDLCWFAKPASEGRQPCLFWTSWKRQIPRERRLHSLTSLLAGCGWITSNTNRCAVRVERGIIVVDECDGGWKTSVLESLNDLQRSGISSGERAAICVFGCRPSDIPIVSLA